MINGTIYTHDLHSVTFYQWQMLLNGNRQYTASAAAKDDKKAATAYEKLFSAGYD
jgi:hypothetical protein